MHCTLFITRGIYNYSCLYEVHCVYVAVNDEYEFTKKYGRNEEVSYSLQDLGCSSATMAFIDALCTFSDFVVIF